MTEEGNKEYFNLIMKKSGLADTVIIILVYLSDVHTGLFVQCTISRRRLTWRTVRDRTVVLCRVRTH